jgi:hypothetical protein
LLPLVERREGRVDPSVAPSVDHSIAIDGEWISSPEKVG